MSDWQLRPARDHGLPLRQRLVSQGREPGLGGLMIAGLWRRLVWLYLRLAHRLQVVGKGNLPAAPFVIVANHTSHLDALVISAGLPASLGRRAFALAAGDTFFTSLPLAAFAVYAINALPVWRKRTTQADLDALRDRLTVDGAVLILFPEGTRSRDGTMGKFRSGVGALVAGRPIPVVPCFLEGCHAAWPPNQRLPRPGRLRLIVGAPLDFAAADPGRAGTVEIARVCEAAVRALAPVAP